MKNLASVSPTTKHSIWQAHLKALQRSGLTRAEYCRQHNQSYHALSYWKRKLDRPKTSVPKFVSVPALRVSSQGPGSFENTATFKIDLGAKFKIEIYDGFSPATLSRIISTLQDY